MTPLTCESVTNVKRVPTERVTLDLEAKAIYAARLAAENANQSLSEWIGEAAWRQALVESAKRFAEYERLHPDEFPGWMEENEARMFREGDA